MMTEDELCVTMGTKSGSMDAQAWADYFSMGKPQQQATGQLYKDAIWSAGGQSAWTDALQLLGVAATIFGEASGIGTAFTVLKAL